MQSPTTAINPSHLQSIKWQCPSQIHRRSENLKFTWLMNYFGSFFLTNSLYYYKSLHNDIYRIIRSNDRGYYQFVQKKFPQKWRNMVIILGRLLLHFYLNFLWIRPDFFPKQFSSHDLFAFFTLFYPLWLKLIKSTFISRGLFSIYWIGWLENTFLELISKIQFPPLYVYYSGRQAFDMRKSLYLYN